MKTGAPDPLAFHSLNISRSGLSAQRRRMDAISENLANTSTTRGANGGPYQPKVVVMEESPTAIGFTSPLPGRLMATQVGHLDGDRVVESQRQFRGVQENTIVQDRRPRMEYDPEHPDADENGYVAYPDINVVEEMTNLVLASRAWEANLTAMKAAKDIAAKSLEI